MPSTTGMRHWLTYPAKTAAAALLALLCACLGAWLLGPGSAPGAVLTRASYDSYFAWFNLAEGPPGSAPVFIIYLDLESHLNLRQDPTLPWPRELHAKLLQRLTDAGARAVVFDVVFDSPGTNAVANRLLRDAIAAHGHVVLAGELSVATQSTGGGVWPRTTKLALPIDTLRDVSAAWGLGEVSVDDDFVARQHFAGREADGEMRPSLTWATARALGLTSVDRGDGPVAPRWLRYYGPPFTLPHRSFSQVLEGSAGEDAVFRNKIVLIGARPMSGLFKERRDEFRSPFNSWHERDLFMPGVEVHATQMLNLLRGDWLTRPGSAGELFAVLLAGALWGAGLLWLRPVPATVAAAVSSAAVVAGAVLLFHFDNLWFPWLILAAVQIPVAWAGSVLFHSLEWYRDRRRLEAARRVADARIREQAALIRKAQDAILVLGFDGRITHANPSAERLYGWPLAELMNGAAQAAFDEPVVAEARRLALKQGEWSGELRQLARSGKPFIVESRWTLLRDEAGRPTGLLVINSDVTGRKQLEAESMRMQRMEAIGALAGGMAHDLNNALAPVLMGTQLLRRDATDDNSRRILSLMEAGTRRAADMVRQVLLFARGREGEFERLDARPLVREMAKLVWDTFPQGISVSAHVADDLWSVRGNATQLHQVLLNLCVNARDSMLEGGSLSLAADNVELTGAEAHALPAARPGAFVVLIVSDTGHGIPAEILPVIFEPFFTTKAEGQGTGLGLSTTARIVKAHGGFMAVQSRPGEGATFEVYLPRFSETVPETAPDEADSSPRGHGELILVADDDEAVRELLRHCLEEHGYRVLMAGNGAEAVSLFKKHSSETSLVISDQSMPVMDGSKAVAAIREMRDNIPVVILSGEGGLSEVGAVLDPLVFRLPKPVALDTLLRVVSRGLGVV